MREEEEYKREVTVIMTERDNKRLLEYTEEEKRKRLSQRGR